ncbi:MAG TPA: PQQ-binding-like beta-propeller repeat protein [Steroidobacteraceae bacterium]|nr:PQQ-binding-like beta-propeller repeat protein [Steroidobacteraceae bacterium]
MSPSIRLRGLLALAALGCCLDVAAAVPPPAPAVSSSLKDIKELESRRLTSDPETWPGAKVYQGLCVNCHEGQVAKAPHRMFLQMMSADAILAALDEGLMRNEGALLTPEKRRQVAEYLAGAPLDAAIPKRAPPRCAGNDFDAAQAPVPLGWGYDNARFIPADVAGLTRDQVPKLKLQWAFAFPGAIRARSQPAIAYGAVYVGSQDGTVYALDLHKGCVRWTYRNSTEVRTAIVPDTQSPRLYFGDITARVHAVDAKTGKLLWSNKIDAHPNATVTGTPTLHDGTLYVPVSSLEVTTAADAKYECCKFRGAVVALDAKTGASRWKAYTITEKPRPVRTTSLGTRIFAPSGAPVWNSPTVDAQRGVLYVGSGENYSSPANDRSDAVLAFRLQDGKLMWSRQMLAGDAWNVGCMMQNNPNCPAEKGPDVDVASGTILHELPSGGRILLAGQKNGYVYGLDPDNGGKVLWKTRVGRGGIQGGVHFGMALEGDRLFVPISDLVNGHDGRTYDSPPRPGLYALDAVSGKLVWSSPAADDCHGRPFCDPGISAPVTAIPGVVFAGHMDGVLRAYDSATGQVIWSYDSAHDVRTVSGAMAHGGSFGGAGVAIRDGHVVVNSGYGLYFHMPGNVLLVFAAAR